ncbi:MATE family efflux transporter [Faecalicoccus pleomorphus]|uniref:MATE family efflux transporter n=2 Tax=Faecalicoccus TaxID=1573536 RepID=UPI001C7092EA|nr:MATE family efflux transporter [Faecalicoccus pleomorphus]
MAGMIIGSFSNILLDWVFIFPCGWGMFGAAFATGLAPIISLCITSMHFLQKKNTFHVSRCTFSMPQALQIVSMGLPSLVTEAASAIVIILFNMLFMHLDGNTAVAAYGIVANISLVVLSVFTGIAQGIQPILSKAYGQQNHRALQKIYGYAIKTMLVYAIFVFLFLVWKSDGITTIFNSQQNEHLQVLANQGIVLYFIACPFAGFNIITSITFSSTQLTVYGQILSLLRSLILIVPMALLLAFTLGIPGIWLSFPVTEILVSLYGFTLIKKNLYSL